MESIESNSCSSPNSGELKPCLDDTITIPTTSVTLLTPKVRRDRLYSQLLATIIVSWESIITGYASAYTSPADLSMKIDLNITAKEVSWISGLLPVGALIGSLSGGGLIEQLGRKHTLIITDIIFLIAWIINYFSQNHWNMYISRLLLGYSVGITSFTIPVYLAETVQPKIRGRLGLFPAAFGNFGILLCFVLGNVMKWRGLAGVGALLPIPFLVVVWLIPDTPRWYMSKKKVEKSRKSLQWLRGDNCNIEREFDDLLHKHSVMDRGIKLIFTKHYFKSFLIVMGLMFFQQFSGINAVIFYTTEIFEQSGSSIDSFISTAVVGCVNFMSTFIASTLVDKLGRKLLLYISTITMTITLIVLGVYFYLLQVLKLDLRIFGWLPLTIFILYILGFSLGFGPIPWLMMSEILPAAVRGHAASICTAFNWTCTFIITTTFPASTHLIGSHGTYWLLASIMLVSLVFLKVYVPETKRKSLEEIERLLAGD